VRGLSDDDKLPLLSRRFPMGLRLLLVAVVSIALMMFDSSHNAMAPIRSSLSVAMQPLQVLVEAPADALAYLRRFSNRGQLIARNDALSRKVLLLQARLQRLSALEAENERIRALLESSQDRRQEVLIAGILSASANPYQHYITLDKGSLDGVYSGQVLVDANGIMGQILSVTPTNSRAILITDANHAIPVEINRTGLRTIAEGTGKSGQLHLPFLPKSADIQEDDLLVSSGLGGRYPSGYPVATVSEVAHPPGSEFLAVTATPTARLNHGEEVLLVWRQKPALRVPLGNPALATIVPLAPELDELKLPVAASDAP